MFYVKEDNDMISGAMKARIDLQYYADRPIDDGEIEQISRYCKVFFIKTKDIISRITEAQIKELREILAKGKK